METYISEIPEGIKRIKIDIGLSYGAPQSQKWLEHNKDLFVYGFEPNPECVANILQGNIVKRHASHGDCISNENLNRLCVIPVALGNVTEPTTMQFYQMLNDCGTSSLFEPIDINLGDIKSIISVPVYSLKHFFDKFDWERFPIIEYIKIDAQGSDYDILLSAGDYLRERVVYITAEAESKQYANISNNTFENMKHYLESQGFLTIQHYNTNDPTFLNKKYLHMQDDIYIYQNG